MVRVRLIGRDGVAGREVGSAVHRQRLGSGGGCELDLVAELGELFDGHLDILTGLPLHRIRVRGHIAVCVLAAVVEQLIGNRLRDADLRDPDLDEQHLSADRAIQELDRIRQVTFTAGRRPSPRHPPHRPATADPVRPRRRHPSRA
jgi:hypothetical protein